MDYADIDNDGDWDCFITNHSTTMKLLENDGAGYFTDVTVAAGLISVDLRCKRSWQTWTTTGLWMSLSLVAFTACTRITAMELSLRYRYFRAVTPCTVLRWVMSTEMEASIFTRVTGMDITRQTTVMTTGFGSILGMITIGLRSICMESFQQRCSRCPVELTGSFGTMLREVRSGESYGITNSFACMFGLGTHETIDVATFYWPSGTVTTVENPEVDQYHSTVEAECVTAITLEFSGSTTPCPDDVLTITTVENFESYAWSDGTTGESLTVSESGTYSVVATDLDGCTAISEPISVDFIESAIPEIIVIGEDVFCSGDSVLLSATDGAGWLWSNGSRHKH